MHLSCNLDIYQKIALQKSKTPFGCNWKKHVWPSTMYLWHADKDKLTITLLEEKKYHLINFLCFQIGGLHISFLFIGKWNDFHIVSAGNFKKKIFKIWTMSGDDYSSWSEKFRWTTQEQQLNSFLLRSYNLHCAILALVQDWLIKIICHIFTLQYVLVHSYSTRSSYKYICTTKKFIFIICVLLLETWLAYN